MNLPVANVKLADREKLVRAVRSGIQNVPVLVTQTSQDFRDRVNGNKEATPRLKQILIPFCLKDVIRRQPLRLDLGDNERDQEDVALDHTDGVGTMLAKIAKYELASLM